MSGVFRGWKLYSLISVLALLAAMVGTQYDSLGETGGSLARAGSLSSISDPSPPYYAISVVPGSLIVVQGSSASVTIILASLDGFSATPQCGGYWWGHLSIATMVSPSVTFAPSASVTPSCLMLSSGGTSSATLIVATTTITRLGTYVVTVTADWQVSPSGWSTGSEARVQVTVIPDGVTVTTNGYSTSASIIAIGVGLVAGIVLIRRRPPATT